MATLLYSTSYGSDDPTRATIAFVGALGAIDAGHRSGIALLGEATFLMKAEVSDHVHGVGWPPLDQLWPQVVEHEIPVYVRGGCGRARGVLDSDLEGKNARFITPAEFTEATLAADRVISI